MALCCLKQNRRSRSTRIPGQLGYELVRELGDGHVLQVRTGAHVAARGCFGSMAAYVAGFTHQSCFANCRSVMASWGSCAPDATTRYAHGPGQAEDSVVCFAYGCMTLCVWRTFTTMCKLSCSAQLNASCLVVANVALMGSSPLRAVLALDACRTHRHVAAYANAGRGKQHLQKHASKNKRKPTMIIQARRMTRRATGRAQSKTRNPRSLLAGDGASGDAPGVCCQTHSGNPREQ